MNAEQVQQMIDAAALALEKANNASPNALIFFGGFMAMVVVIVSLSLVFVVVRLLAVQTLFITNMTGRSVMANEQIRLSTDTQTQAITGQTNAITAMNQTGLNTSAAVAGVDKKVILLLGLAEIMGVDVKNLAQHAVNPTAETEKNVQTIADKPPAAVPVVAPAAVPVPVAEPGGLTLPATVTITAADITPA